MSEANGKVCCNCKHNIRSYNREYNQIVCHCEIKHEYLSYMQVMEGWCRRWAKEREVGEQDG